MLHVITRMVRGGAQENTLASVVGLHGVGWESSLATGPALGLEGSLEPECLAAGVRLLRVPELLRELSPRHDLVALRRLAVLFLRERPHVVHTHTSKAGILGRVAARWARVPVVVHTPHGHVFHSYEGRVRTRLFVKLEQACASWADRLVALTDTERGEHLERGIGRPDQWVTVHSGVDFSPLEASRGMRSVVRSELGLPESAAVLGTVGRLVPVKGHQFLIHALATLSASYPCLHLLLVGDGPLRSDLVAQARSLGLHVRFHGEASTAGVPNDCGLSLHQCAMRNPQSKIPPTVHVLGLRRDVPRLLAAMDLFVLPSVNEGMGRVLVEAMAMELPCVASRVSGTPDVVDHGITGLLAAPRDPMALAQAIGRLLDDPALGRAMGRRGRGKVVPAFGVDRMVSRLETLYGELLEAKGILHAGYQPCRRAVRGRSHPGDRPARRR